MEVIVGTSLMAIEGTSDSEVVFLGSTLKDLNFVSPDQFLISAKGVTITSNSTTWGPLTNPLANIA